MTHVLAEAAKSTKVATVPTVSVNLNVLKCLI